MQEKIIKVSIPLFDEKGYSETSIQDIVDSLGVTKGTFYYYYKSKQELLKDIILSYIEHILEQQSDILADLTKSNEEKLFNVLHMIISNIRTLKQSARIFIREIRHIKEDNLVEIKQRRKQFKNNLQHLIDEGIKVGEFKEHLKTNILTLGILGMTNWTYYWYDPDGSVSEQELTELFMQFITDGIKR